MAMFTKTATPIAINTKVSISAKKIKVCENKLSDSSGLLLTAMLYDANSTPAPKLAKAIGIISAAKIANFALFIITN